MFTHLCGNVQYVYFSRLHILGIRNEIGYFVLAFIGVAAVYLLLRPAIIFLITFQSVRLLTYLTSSLVIVIICLLTLLFIGDTKGGESFFKYVLQTIALFGGILLFLHIIGYIFFQGKT